MKKLFLILCPTFLLLNTINAQSNIVNLYMNNFQNYNTQTSEIPKDKLLSKYYSNSKYSNNSLPYIEYIHFTKKNYGYGIFFSFQQSKQNFQNQSNYIDTSTTNFNSFTYTSKQQSIHFGFSIQEKTMLKKYTILSSLELPIAYFSPNNYSSVSTYSNSSNSNFSSSSRIEKSAKSMSIGLHCKINAYRKIYKGLNAHIALDGGFNYNKPFGNGSLVSFNNNNSNTTTNTYDIITKKSNSTYFNLTPIFGLSYFF